MSTNTETVIDFEELRTLSIPCQKCKTSVRMDLADEEANVPESCPCCGLEYREAFRSTLFTLRQVYRKLSDAGERPVQVCIPHPLP